MKIYTENTTEDQNVEMLLNLEELKTLINVLEEFERDIQKFKSSNPNKMGLGFTHLHLKDHKLIGTDSTADVILYINLDE